MREMAAKAPAPIIGITPDVQSAGASQGPDDTTFLLSATVTCAILNAGGIPVILPQWSPHTAAEDALIRLDGILVSGGNFDIHPRHYGATAREPLRVIKEDRTEFELEVIAAALGRDIPLLGICGGEQAINVALGGSLVQDIATEIPDAAEHEQKGLKNRSSHPVHVIPGTKLRQIVKRDAVSVNSTHHQAVKKLGKHLVTNATAPDGITEGIESVTHSFVLGVQWHPEYLSQQDISQSEIFKSFVAACRKR